MQKLFLDTANLDLECVNLGINQEILMENAASGVENIIREKLEKNSKILVVCGTGNNAADGLCLARRISGDYDVSILLVSENLNKMAKFQLEILEKVGVKKTTEIYGFDCYVDAIFGSGLNRDLDDKVKDIIFKINSIPAFKIAIDIPTGINKFGQVIDKQTVFKSDITVAMGTLKLGFYLDVAKDFVGEVRVANLGVSRIKFEKTTNYFLLENNDIKLPLRDKFNVNKGDFGHLYVISGDMEGAGILAALAANALGAGLVSLVSDKRLFNLPYQLMQKSSLKNAKFVVAGPGLGEKNINLDELTNKICVIDADLCYKKNIINLLKNNPNLVITPHPKEFSSLLRLANIADVSVSEIQDNRFKFAKIWSEKFDSVLVLKGANTIIAKNGYLYICDLGNQALAKGGSGDVLAGFIGAFLTQNYSILDASINGVLAHALSLNNFSKNSYSLTPLDIIEGVKCL
ncbi:NAD(P)H-hydrate dehydratase [Campylobacter sp. FMV-PI01]|uniref:Bifunctional NAD(P)H-hydrate repair enzyme n=1 Tax=Campylobacter portucalensis TaxID=2608384 RepID=A0A6L5WFU6_9BACT|nr:NAD(P)H-hydrate dehydratase [Campylobacter portucalensis]MSN95759.1 NAD(P)H-hydrate dehydratase [Campylobacter portucalensis]